jgi:hypothetical protein
MRTRFFAIAAGLAVVGMMATPRVSAVSGDGLDLPLNSAYVCFTQEELKALDASVDDNDLLQATGVVQGGSRQIVLCVGHDIAAAVKASATNFAVSDQPVPIATGAPGDTLWLAAYLGSDGSTPPAFRVRAVNVANKTIRLSYERIEAAERSCDYHAYMVWVPVGRVEAGDYTLELFDLVGEATLSRTWRVIAK